MFGPQFEFKPFKPGELTNMYLAFLDAFSDYPIEFKLSKEQFVRKFVEKLKIDFELSIGAYDYEALIGFIFTTVAFYEGYKTAYNGGTGVKPGYRGNQLTQKMYHFLLPKLVEKNIRRCVLEVLVQNDRAIKAYKSIGFEPTKRLKCFRLNKPLNLSKSSSQKINIFSPTFPNWSLYESFANYKPSFLDTSAMIMQNLANEKIIEAHIDGQCVGYAIFQPPLGRIGQIAVNPVVRGQGVGNALLEYIYENSQQKSLTIMNINEHAQDMTGFFLKLGFENQIDQYEMTLSLDEIDL